MNVEIGTETPIFLFWEYLFRNFGILSLQCGQKHRVNNASFMLLPHCILMFSRPTEFFSVTEQCSNILVFYCCNIHRVSRTKILVDEIHYALRKNISYLGK